jgi:tetratricopeptide (TPR) repeat protein
VTSVLEGSVRKQGNRVRVTAQLIDVADGFHLWSETFERELTDIFAVQEEIARAIAGALRVELTGEDEAALADRGTESIDAYNSYLLGRYYWNKRTPDGLWSAVEAFEEAIELDPDYALAYAGLADAYSIMASYGNEAPREVFPRAKEAALAALARDDDLAAGHLSLAFIQTAWDWDWEVSENTFRRVLELDADNAFAYYWYCILLNAMGRSAEAEAMVLRARQLDPLAPEIGTGVSRHYVGVGDFDKAETVLQEVLDVHPGFPGAVNVLGFIRLRQGRYEEVLQLSERYEAVTRRHIANRVEAFWGLGRHDEALALISQARAEAGSIYWDPVRLAGLYAIAGDTEEVFNLLERGYEERSNLLALGFWARSQFDPVRSDPRFSELIRRVGLDPAVWVP